MALPWLRLVDTLLDVTNLALSARVRRTRDIEPAAGAARTSSQLETGLANVVVAALKEAFDRDARRLDLERERMEQERERADRALKLELLRQAGEREIGRLRLVAGVAFVSLIGALFFLLRLGGGALGARVVVGFGWLLLLASLAVSFVAQSSVSGALARIDEVSSRDQSVAGSIAAWLLVAGLAAVGLAALIA